MNRLIIGIDPGANGGVAEIYPAGRIQTFNLMDDADLVEYFETLPRADFSEIIIYLEQVGGYIGKAQPGSSMFKFGDGYGFIRGVVAANHLKLVFVRPQAWQKSIPCLKGVSGPARKRVLKEHAARMFPGIKVTLSTADALLIAEYGRTKP